MNDITKENKNNVSLIFDAKKDEAINYSWLHYCKYPEMKGYLIHEHIGNQYILRDIRTNNIIMGATFSLEKYLK